MYEEIDKILFPWSKEKGLVVRINDSKEETRSIIIVDGVGREYQMRPRPDAGNSITIVMYLPESRKNEFLNTELKYLRSALDEAYEDIKGWIEEKH